MKLYYKYVRLHFLGLLQYRGAFWLSFAGQFFNTLLTFAGVLFLFARFGSVGGWTVGETALCFACSFLSFSLAECFLRGFDSFSSLVRRGDFDRLLVRPRGTVVQVLGSAIDFSRFGRIAQALLVFIWALQSCGVQWTPARAFVCFSAILSGFIVFGSIFILGAAFSFVTIEGMEFVNLFTDGGREVTKYPIDIYPRWFAWLFTFIIPLGMFNYYPLLLLTGRSSSIWCALAPWMATLFLIPALLIWRRGVRAYLSTGN